MLDTGKTNINKAYINTGMLHKENTKHKLDTRYRKIAEAETCIRMVYGKQTFGHSM